jgi:hypothetical protein
MRIVTRLIAAAAFAFAASQLSNAQVQTNPPSGGAAPAAPAESKPKKKPMSPEMAEMKAKAKECSKKADEKGLHGKARKEFREKCKHGEE